MAENYEALVARIRYHIQKADFMGLKEHEGTLLLKEAADAIEGLLAYCNNQEDALKDTVDELDGKDKVLKQVYWERDTALHQLAEIGKGLGEKMDDIVERKHGEWEKHNDGIMIWWECSECNHDAWYDRDDLHNYCPWCGARMDSEEEK